MCLGRVIVSGADGAREITDVVDIVMDGGNVKVSTLFGEQHEFSRVTIDHIAMRSGVVISLACSQ